jgi:transcriptional regulator with XRE-family HTH domain
MRRLKLRLSQEAMAKLLGIDMSTYQRWETGGTSPRLVDMDRVDALLDELEFGKAE